jgi:hypothetical protein
MRRQGVMGLHLSYLLLARNYGMETLERKGGARLSSVAG